MNCEHKKMSKGKKALVVIACILGVIILSISIIAVVSCVSASALLEAARQVESVQYNHAIIMPECDADGRAILDDNGCYNFVDKDNILASRNFRVLQLTDIHIGAGAFSMREDNWTLKTVEDLVRRAQPDLVVVTGDISYPVPFQSGTMNNRNSGEVFAELMERLGVYWTLVFGNHDSEAYSYYNRVGMGELYASDRYEHCLFDNTTQTLNDGSKVYGVGNFAINVRDSAGELVHTLFMLDSNAYLPDDPLGIQWKYDKIHDDQLEWYIEMCEKIGIVADSSAKSTAYFHIPPKDLVDVVNEWNETGDSNTIIQRDGVMGEYIAGGTKIANDMYDIFTSHGTTGLFCGHDHKNNASYWYDKDGIDTGKIGLRMTYGMSIDYLAYPGIYKLTSQRGGRMIEINTTNRLMLSEGSNNRYDKTHFGEDRQCGFYTYHLPYWNDLYRDK